MVKCQFQGLVLSQAKNIYKQRARTSGNLISSLYLVNTFYDLFPHICMSPDSPDSHMKVSEVYENKTCFTGLLGTILKQYSCDNIQQMFLNSEQKLISNYQSEKFGIISPKSQTWKTKSIKFDYIPHCYLFENNIIYFCRQFD